MTPLSSLTVYRVTADRSLAIAPSPSSSTATAYTQPVSLASAPGRWRPNDTQLGSSNCPDDVVGGVYLHSHIRAVKLKQEQQQQQLTPNRILRGIQLYQALEGQGARIEILSTQWENPLPS